MSLEEWSEELGEDWEAVVPFLPKSEEYALGVDFAMIFIAMHMSNEIRGVFDVVHQEAILLAANRLGFNVHQLERMRGKKNSKKKKFFVQMSRPDADFERETFNGQRIPG